MLWKEIKFCAKDLNSLHRTHCKWPTLNFGLPIFLFSHYYNINVLSSRYCTFLRHRTLFLRRGFHATDGSLADRQPLIVRSVTREFIPLTCPKRPTVRPNIRWRAASSQRSLCTRGKTGGSSFTDMRLQIWSHVDLKDRDMWCRLRPSWYCYVSAVRMCCVVVSRPAWYRTAALITTLNVCFSHARYTDLIWCNAL